MAKVKQIFTTPEGRLVSGHPMEVRTILDDKTNQPKLDGLGKVRTQTYFAIAMAKGNETGWEKTQWGQLFYAAAITGFPNGEYKHPSFAWKVIDGDSTIHNKKGKKPFEREGYAGHWVISCSTELTVKCFHVGKYDPIEQIQNDKEIKRGDYIRVRLEVTDNSPSQSPGIYVNPTLVELSRIGARIQGEGPDAAEAFGSDPYGTNTPPVPSGAKKITVLGCQYTYEELVASGWSEAQMIAEGYYKPMAPAPVPKPAAPPPKPVAPPPAPKPPVAPARDLAPAAPPKKRTLEGSPYTYEELIAAGWNEAQMMQMGYLSDDIPF